jgi:quercetin dioxygenase-like cupin family protein
MHRAWDIREHLRHLEDEPWVTMLDEEGWVLPGIEGKRGVRGRKDDGTHIGLDFIRMQPGSAFPLHVHDGDHELYVIAGSGFVHIDGCDIPVVVGNAIHIPAEYPHGVRVPEGLREPLVFVAIGHPHKHVHALNRMREVKSESSS